MKGRISREPRPAGEPAAPRAPRASSRLDCGTDAQNPSGRTFLQEKISVKKEREPKDDGRYIIFYTFEDEGEEPEEQAPKTGDGV